MYVIKEFQDMPQGYLTDAQGYFDADAKKIAENKESDITNDITANEAILNKNIGIAQKNITTLNNALSNVSKNELAIRDELAQVQDIISKHTNDGKRGWDSEIPLTPNEVALLAKFGINDPETSTNTPALYTKANSTANELMGKLNPNRASVEADIAQQQNAIKEFEAQKNIQTERLKYAKSSILQDSHNYGIAMALSLFQLKCAKNSNNEAYVKLQEVKKAQEKSGEIAEALEAARNLNNAINEGCKADDAKYKTAYEKLEKALKKVAIAVDPSTIKLNDGSGLTDELKKKLTVFETIEVNMPSISLKNDDDRKKAMSSVDDVVNSLTTWQTTYSNKVNTIMTELNDASSKYSNYISGSNQALQKSTDILSKLVGLYV